MNVRYRVTLTTEERVQLQALVKGGKAPVRKLKRAQVLLAADLGSSDEAIAINVAVGTLTVYRTKRRFVEEGIEQALSEDPRPGAARKLSATEEALLVATACTKPPAGHADWTMHLLADEMVRLTAHDTLSDETVRRRLAEKDLKPWQHKMWCLSKINAEFVARMEDVLALYGEAPDQRRPVACFDETPRQLIGEARVPVPVKPGKPARVDYEYVRNGTANVFMFVDAHHLWRHAKVTDRRAASDFAACVRDLVDVHYPEADLIRVVLDNLSTHTPAALYESFPPAEQGRVKLAALRAFGRGEGAEEVFVDAAEQIPRAVLLVAEADGADAVDQLAEAPLVEGGPGVVFGQHALEGRIVPLDGDHGVVDELADGGLFGLALTAKSKALNTLR